MPDIYDLEYPEDFEDIPPSGFYPDDMTDAQAEYANLIREVLGQPLADLVIPTEEIASNPQASANLRASRFQSGLEAMIWLFKRGIFLYSSIIQFSDGTWGVAIGDSPGASGGNQSENPNVATDLIF